MEECFESTDLRWRLAQIPDSAGCRGVFFNMLDQRAADFGPSVRQAYREFFQITRFSTFRMYPVKDYLTRLVKLAQLQFGAPNIYKGIFALQAGAWPAWRQTVLGRASFAVMGNNLSAILRLIAIQFNHVLNYGQLQIQEVAPGRFHAVFENQYVYIEHAMAGALSGVAEACGYQAELAVHLTDAFNGSVEILVKPAARMS